MRSLCYVFVCTVFYGVPALAQQAQFPNDFLGEWSADVENSGTCRTGDFEKKESDGLIKVSRREISYWESGCSLNGISRKGNTVTARLSCSGEGNTWRVNNVMGVSKISGQSHLVVYSDQGGYLSIYRKCR